MNKWHIKHPKDERRTMCGRLTKKSGSNPRTARRVTEDIKKFKTRPCGKCLKALEEMKRREKCLNVIVVDTNQMIKKNF